MTLDETVLGAVFRDEVDRMDMSEIDPNERYELESGILPGILGDRASLPWLAAFFG